MEGGEGGGSLRVEDDEVAGEDVEPGCGASIRGVGKRLLMSFGVRGIGSVWCADGEGGGGEGEPGQPVGSGVGGAEMGCIFARVLGFLVLPGIIMGRIPIFSWD